MKFHCTGSRDCFELIYDVPCVIIIAVCRAGRGRMPSHAHLFYSSRRAMDKELENFVLNQCRRRSLLKSIGGLEGSSDQYGCCDVCTDGRVVSSRLDILTRKTTQGEGEEQ